jgi:hypothetical protein
MNCILKSVEKPMLPSFYRPTTFRTDRIGKLREEILIARILSKICTGDCVKGSMGFDPDTALASH